ncbi:MAG: ABC transporter ATP-binding protein [Mesorhizobium sp.]|uniref:ABC transporter ATP-binding protein n=1 Tax=Mesorhizobium sp. TaxID=1871066 RepID=UPI000FEA6D9E|nr:ABC transporter ATP-binding protein [Mesorhizobium sp.]RWD28359.1 MAG: ABC transporter ATP-binding protein [Mesorhizobium sp.]
MTETLLDASNLAIEIDGRELVSDVDLKIGRGDSVGIVGESGSGKSLTCRAFAGSLGVLGGRISRGTMSLAGRNVTSPGAHAGLYGRVVTLMPQNSLSALNPLMRIGTHLTETIKALDTDGAITPKVRATQLLDRVGLHHPERVLRQYPHQLSGGMRQRVMIALAIAGRPQLLIADEPTTALDVSVQKEILELLRRLNQEEDMGLILVSHDLGVVKAATQSVAVMYGGMVVEHGTTDTVLRHPRHPYTQALLRARPVIGRTERLIGIPGIPASPDAWPSGCRFARRCPHVRSQCDASVPTMETIDAHHVVACSRVHELTTGDLVGA